MIWLASILTAAAIGFFAWKKSGADRWLDRAMQTKRAMQAELARDGVAEDDPVVRDLAQAARDRGEV